MIEAVEAAPRETVGRDEADAAGMVPSWQPWIFPTASPANALTVDLEDWYHVCGVSATADTALWDAYESRVTRSTDTILSLLRTWRVRATFFVLGYIAAREPALVRAIAREGHEVATHGHFHRRIFELSPREFAADLAESLDAIAAAGGGLPVGYRAPEWSMRPQTLWALPVLRKHGIRYDASMVPLTRMGHRSFPRFPCRTGTRHGDIVEFPLTSVRCFGEHLPFTGGLPLRLAPYFYVLSKIRQLNGRGQPAVIYVHPWEFDVEQPHIELPWTRKFMHYFNLSATPRKLEGFLRHLRLTSIQDVLGI